MTNWFGNFIVTWPLMLACSISTTDNSATFKIEHIIPQLLLQWVCLTHKLDGIKFISTRAKNNYTLSKGTHVNYVIPAKSDSKEGYCKQLQSKIKFTESISWQTLNIINPNAMNTKLSKKDFSLRIDSSLPPIMQIEMPKGKIVDYFNTAFGRIEVELFKLPATIME